MYAYGFFNMANFAALSGRIWYFDKVWYFNARISATLMEWTESQDEVHSVKKENYKTQENYKTRYVC